MSGPQMVLEAAETDAINTTAAAPAAVAATIEVLHFGQQLVALVVRLALRVVPVPVVLLIFVVAIRGLVPETTKLFVFALHETHVLTTRAPLQKELGPSGRARHRTLGPVARVPRHRRRFVRVQVLREWVHRFGVLLGGVILREQEHPPAAARGLVAVHRDFAGGLAVRANRVDAVL